MQDIKVKVLKRPLIRLVFYIKMFEMNSILLVKDTQNPIIYW